MGFVRWVTGGEHTSHNPVLAALAWLAIVATGTLILLRNFFRG